MKQSSSDSPDTVMIGTFKHSTVEFVSLNILTGKVNVIGKNDKISGGYPRKLDISDTGKTVYIVYNAYVNDTYKSVLYTYGVSESPEINPNSQDKKPKNHFPYSGETKSIGDNFIAICNQESGNLLEAKVFGKVSYSKPSSPGHITQYYEVKDFSLKKDNSVICITRFNDDSFHIEVFPVDPNIPHYSHEVREIKLVKFFIL